ncbi:MAG: GNAT family N-acetyltransferase [Planctomycetia bacterium]|nr:GNAT family N-acetyltransferase [Planctomycetia bacterium]
MIKTNFNCAGKYTLLPVRGRRMLNDFIRVAWIINRRDPNWIPPLICEVKEFLNPKKHPFYAHGSAEKFVLYRNNVPVGRILVSDDPVLNERQGTNFGAWGMFECIDDTEAAAMLFDAAKKWSRENFGRTSLLGPIDYSTNYPIGLLVRGFDTPPRYSMNHNPPYYEKLILACGMKNVQGMYAWWFRVAPDMLEKWGKRSDWLEKRTRIAIRPFEKRHIARDTALCKKVYNAALGENWNYAELSEKESAYFARRLVQFSDVGHIFLALDQSEPVGFAACIPDLNEAIKPLNGRLFPFGFLKLLRNRSRINTARMMVLCVHPNYRRRGISERLILRTLEYGLRERGYTHAELGWTYRDNHAVNRIIERCGAIPYKTYHLYETSC